MPVAHVSSICVAYTACPRFDCTMSTDLRVQTCLSQLKASLSLSPSLYSRAVTIISPPLNCAASSSEQQMRVSVTDILMAPFVNAFSPFLYFFS